jgi:hypothetical protein
MMLHQQQQLEQQQQQQMLLQQHQQQMLVQQQQQKEQHVQDFLTSPTSLFELRKLLQHPHQQIHLNPPKPAQQTMSNLNAAATALFSPAPAATVAPSIVPANNIATLLQNLLSPSASTQPQIPTTTQRSTISHPQLTTNLNTSSASTFLLAPQQPASAATIPFIVPSASTFDNNNNNIQNSSIATLLQNLLSPSSA